MNNYSIENLKELYGWLEENPNKRIHKNGFSVIVFDCFDTLDNNPQYGCGFGAREHIFGTKEDAWLFFQNELQEHSRRDFWDYVDWNDDVVVSTHYDEGGWTHVWIEKWDGFDEDVKVSWEYDGVKYKSLKELWKEVPIFQGNYMETDRPWISVWDEVNKKGYTANLSVDLSESFYARCEEKRKELEAEKEEAERRRKEFYEKLNKQELNNIGHDDGDLPF